MTNVRNVYSIGEAPPITAVPEDEGFTEVRQQDLCEAVQTAIKAFTQEYNVTAIGHNAEKQLTKVKLMKKEGQTEKVVYLDAEGKETAAPAPQEKPRKLEETEGVPSSL